MLTETEPRLDLDAAALIALDATGIDGSVIDLLVALAYPERFTVQRRSRSSSGSSGWSNWGGGGSGLGWAGTYDPIWYSDLYPYYLTPLGYGAWGRGYSPYFYNYGTNPFISIRDATIAAREAAPRAVNGLGYTQVHERTGAGRGTAVPVGSGGTGSGGAVSTGSGGSSSGGRVTSGGYTSGGGAGGGGGRSGGGGGRSGGGGGRTAVPRR